MTFAEVDEVHAETEVEVPPQRAWCFSYCGGKSKCSSINQPCVLLMDSVGLKFRKGSVGLQSSEGLTEAGGSMSEIGCSQGWQVDAGHWPKVPWFLSIWTSPQSCSMTWKLASSRESYLRGKMGAPIYFIT